MKELLYTVMDLFVAIIRLIGMVVFAITFPIAWLNNKLKKTLFTARVKTNTKKSKPDSKK